MNDSNTTSPPQAPPLEDKRLERLYDYTKFHIGIYLSTAAGIAALLGSEKTGWFVAQLVTQNKEMLYTALVFMILAGMCGGIVASSTIEHKNFEDFWEKPQGPTSIPCLRLTGRIWAAWEHAFFWASLLVLAYSIAVGFSGVAPISKEEKQNQAVSCCCSITISGPSCTPTK